jgi:REP element-mobilizing transposase RayT
MKKFQNKYRIPSARLQNWDYGNNGAYFITICVDKMQCVFGNVVSNSNISNDNVETRFIASKNLENKNAENDKKCEMRLNELGKIAHEIWQEIPNKFPYAELGNFVIMPNHMHGILIINKMKISPDENGNENANVETRLIASIQGGIAGHHNPMLHENISRIVRWYKGRCSFEMRKIHADFNWQSRFYDHVIRDSRAFDTIQNYIEENPSKWKKDTFHK